MKKIIFKFWFVNILISIAIFVGYRIVISETNHASGNFFESLLHFLDIILNLAYSLVHLIAMFFCSLLLFLNLIHKIRTNLYLSFFTFSGIPLFFVILIVANGFGYNDSNTISLFRNLLIFSVIYLFFTILEFLLFRKTIIKAQLDK